METNTVSVTNLLNKGLLLSLTEDFWYDKQNLEGELANVLLFSGKHECSK